MATEPSTNSHRDTPDLSVIIPIGSFRERSERSLRAALDQVFDGTLEVVIVDARPDLPRIAGHDDPRVCYVEYPEAKSYAGCKVRGVREAASEYIAFVEDHAFVQPGWAAGVLKGFATGAEVVVYTYLDATPHSYFSRSFMLLSYGKWMSEKFAGERDHGSGNNLAYRKSTLLKQGDDLETMMGTELFLHRRVRAEGGKIWQEASAKLAHSNWPDLHGTLQDTCSCSHLFAQQRILVEKLSWPKRIFFALCMPICPFLIFYRHYKAFAPDPEMQARLLRYSPAFLLYTAATNFIEGLGYLSPKPLLKWHLDVEIHVPRACDTPEGRNVAPAAATSATAVP